MGLFNEEWRKNMEMIFSYLEIHHRSDYPSMIERVAYNFGRGKVVVIPEIIAETLKEAQRNPTKETWEKLKKILLENPPEEKIKKQSRDLYRALKDAVLSGKARIGFHRFRNQQVLLDKLSLIGIKKKFLQNTCNFIQEQIVANPQALDVLRGEICIQMIHKGREWFWDGYGNRKTAQYFHETEIIFDLESSAYSMFSEVLEGLKEDEGLERGSLKYVN